MPADPYEIPLLIQDRNLETAPDGSLTGSLLHKVEDGTVLAPAERADLIVDFRSLRGQRLRLVNTAGAPFDNSPAVQ